MLWRIRVIVLPSARILQTEVLVSFVTLCTRTSVFEGPQKYSIFDVSKRFDR